MDIDNFTVPQNGVESTPPLNPVQGSLEENEKPKDESSFLGVLYGFESDSEWLNVMFDWLHNHRSQDPKNLNEKSPLLMTKKLEVQWDFVIQKDKTIRWDSYERNGSGYGFVASNQTLTKLMSIPNNTIGHYTLGLFGHGATACYSYLTHGKCNWFIIVKTKECDKWFVYEKNLYTQKEVFAEYMTTEEIKNTYTDIPIDRLGGSGLFQRMTIVSPSSLKGSIEMEDNWYEHLAAEIGTRYRRPIQNNLFSMNMTVLDSEDNTFFNESIEPYHQSTVSIDATHETSFKPGNIKKMRLQILERNNKSSDAHKSFFENKRSKVVGYGGQQKSLCSDYYNDHAIVEIVDEDTKVGLDYMELGTKITAKGYLFSSLFVPNKFWTSRTNKINILIKDPRNNKVQSRDKFTTAIKTKLSEYFKQTVSIFSEDSLRDNWDDVVTGEWYPSAWGANPFRYYDTIFELYEVPNFKKTVPKTDDIAKHYEMPFKYMSDNLEGKGDGVPVKNSLILDSYIKDNRTNGEFIKGMLDTPHFHKNANYILNSQNFKEGQHKHLITFFCNSNKKFCISHTDGAIVNIGNKNETNWELKYKKLHEISSKKTKISICNLYYFSLHTDIPEDKRIYIKKKTS